MMTTIATTPRTVPDDATVRDRTSSLVDRGLVPSGTRPEVSEDSVTRDLVNRGMIPSGTP